MVLVTTPFVDPGLTAVARGGPMDGAVLGMADTERYEVIMADRSRWGYVATTDRGPVPTARSPSSTTVAVAAEEAVAVRPRRGSDTARVR